jgi:1-deoxy-D-xylulose-5-phosphate synthase
MARILDSIQSPSDLHDLSREELQQVVDELRELIIETVSRTGGHLASSLGTVELTVALHHIYESPRDKILWDVGHQTYGHKILTGRRDRISTIRKRGGLSGFTNIFESEHDAFGAGHASTSISAALGMAVARDHLGQDHSVIAVIGDGSLTGGMAFEALNNAGSMRTNLLVIVNDNEMSISKNVGALIQYFNKVITGSFYNRAKQDVEGFVQKIPHVGLRLRESMHSLEGGIKGILVPGRLFEDLGFRYFGPVDGHNMEQLIESLHAVKKIPGPRVLHVITRKGKGYAPAENSPEKWHGAKPFDPTILEEEDTPLAPTSPPAYTDVFADTVVEMAREDDRIVGITAAMPSGTGLIRLQEEIPERFYDVGIAEEHAVTFAAGLARAGMRPIVAIYSTFLQRSIDQVIHDVCIQNLPVIFCLDRAGVVGPDGATHQGVFDIAHLRATPNMILMAPSSGTELAQMLRTARQQNRPVVIRYPREKAVRPPRPGEKKTVLPIGRAELVRQGTDVAVFALGAMVGPALEAADLLHERGISCRVVNARYIKPIDLCQLSRAAEEGMKIVTVEDHVLLGGYGSAALEALQTAGYANVEMLRLGIPDRFLDHAERTEMLQDLGLDAAGIAKSIVTMVEEKSHAHL